MSRSPYGERGLKSHGCACRGGIRESLSLRRAWIEMRSSSAHSPAVNGRSPYGERGLKYPGARGMRVAGGRSPYGERGLK